MRVCEIENCNNTIEVETNEQGRAINNRQKCCSYHSKSSSGPNAEKIGMYKRIQKRCEENGREFVMSWEGFLDAFPADNKCPVFGFELINGDDGPMGRNNSPSVDRIDSSKGYTDDNIQIISKLANSMKQNATEEELYKFAEWVLKCQGYAPLKLDMKALLSDPTAIEPGSVAYSKRDYNQTITIN